MLDERHLDIAGEQRKLDGAQFVEGPALAAAARSDGFVPYRSHSFAQRLVLDPLQAGKELRDLNFNIELGDLDPPCNLIVRRLSVDIFEVLKKFFLLFSWLRDRV